MTVHLGIDLGTTYSTVAAARNGRVELLSLGTRGAAVPSVVFVREDGSPLVGEAAEARAQGDPTRFAREFKRRLGDPTPLILGGVPMGAERLSGYVLAYLVERAAQRLGEQPASIVVTHPASYTQYRLDLLNEAVRLAGLPDVRLLAEPRAAAIHYAADNRVQEGETVAVYDFGGGTFDTALVRLRGGEFELIGEPQGIDRFGGIDIDLAVFDYVCDEANDLVGGLDGEESTNRAMLSRLRTDCRLAKERLSDDTETVVAVATPLGARDVVVTRRMLESMIRFRLADTVQALDRAVRTAGLDKSDVSRVLLVGGSSRIPLVRTLLAESFGRPISVDADPESAIALGAAAAAAQWAGGSPVAAGTPPTAAFPAPVVAAAAATADVVDEPQLAPPAAGAAEPTEAVAATEAPAVSTLGAPAEATATMAAPTAAPPAPPAPAPSASAPPAPPSPSPSTATSGPNIPPTPGATGALPPSGGRRKWIVVAIAAVVALLLAGVVVVLANRDSGSDGDAGDGGGSTAASVSDSTTSDSSTDSTSGGDATDVQVGDDVGLNPPDGLTFVPMPIGDVQAFRDLVIGSVGESLDLVSGSNLVDDQNSTKGALVLYQNGGGELTDDDAQAIIDAVVGEESVTEHNDSTVNGVTGQKFLRDDGTVGWIGHVEGAVPMMLMAPDEAGQLEQHLESLAANNLNSTETTTAETTADTSSATTSASTEPPTTAATFSIDNVTLGNLNTADPTMNPPAGFHFEPLSDFQMGLIRSSAELVGPAAPSLHTVLAAPFAPDDGSAQIGGLNQYLGDGSAEFQQQVAATLLASGTDPQSLAVGQFVGTSFTRSNGTPAWVGPFHDSMLLIGLDVGDPTMETMLTLLDAANS